MEISSVSMSACSAQIAVQRISVSGTVTGRSPALAADTVELSDKRKSLSRGLAGKLNALENSNLACASPGFNKALLHKLTGVKLRDAEIDSVQIYASSTSLQSSGISGQIQPGSASLTCENLAVQSRQLSFSVEGSANSRSGGEVAFSLRTDISRLLAEYSRYSWNGSLGIAPGAVDTVA